MIRSTTIPSHQRPGPPLRLRLLSGFEVSLGDKVVNIAEVSQRLVAYLALFGPTSRVVAATALWPDSAEERASANLRSARWRLPPDARDIVVTRCHRLQLAEHVEVDVTTAQQAGWRVVKDPTVADEQDLVPSLLGALLPDWYDDWSVFERERLTQLGIRFAEATVHELIRRSRLIEALDVALQVVCADALRSSAQAALLAVYCAEGNVTQARAQLKNYTDLLRREIGCECPDELTQLVDEALKRRITVKPPPSPADADTARASEQSRPSAPGALLLSGGSSR